MEPFQRNYLIEKINWYNNILKEGSANNYKIIKKTEENHLSYLHKKEEEILIPIPKLIKDDSCLMKLSPLEIQGAYEIIKYARGNVGIVGLGLGYIAQEIAKKDNVKKVTVYESSKEVIDLYKKSFNDNPKIVIINEDAYSSKKKTYDYFLVDIYNYELTDKVVKDYKFFNELHNIEEYVFGGLEHFLLSCSYEEIVWVYIPEVWMMMSKDLFSSLDSSGYIDYYEKLEEDLVSDILGKFKEVLN